MNKNLIAYYCEKKDQSLKLKDGIISTRYPLNSNNINFEADIEDMKNIQILLAVYFIYY